MLLFLLAFLFFTTGPGPVIGVISSVTKDSVMYASGIRYIEESVGNTFSPRKVSEEQFQEKLKRIQQAKVKVVAANSFLPGTLKLVGDDINEKAILGYVDTVMRRCKQAGVEIIVLGSGEARKLPPGYDSVKASKQFISIVRKMAKVAAKYDRTIAIENLNSTETNFVLSLAEALRYVKAVNHPNFRLTADIYHMLMENESAESILAAKGYLVHSHIAEKIERAYPGKRNVDFRPYFAAMKQIGYTGVITMECRWWNFDQELAPAKAYLDKQISELDIR
jgi:sugar phosphate isomerase/epimerase